MSIKENENQNTWFAAKLLIENGFTADADQWLKDPDDEVDPHDSISFDASRRSQRKSECSGKSKKRGQGTASASVKAEAGRAALIARAVLKEKNGLEAEEEQLGEKEGNCWRSKPKYVHQLQSEPSFKLPGNVQVPHKRLWNGLLFTVIHMIFNFR